MKASRFILRLVYYLLIFIVVGTLAIWTSLLLRPILGSYSLTFWLAVLLSFCAVMTWRSWKRFKGRPKTQPMRAMA